MKKSSKILLSTLALTSMLFTMKVNAEELTPTTTQEEQAIVQQETTTKSLSSLTKEEFENLIPSEIEVSITKTDYVNHVINKYKTVIANLVNMEDSAEQYDKMINEDPIIVETKDKLTTLLTEKGITDLNELNISTAAYAGGYSGVEFEYINVFVGDYANVDDYANEKLIKINFKKEENYSKTDEDYVINKVNNLKFYPMPMGYIGEEGVFTIYNIGDIEGASKWTIDTFDFNAFVNDSSITVKKTLGAEGTGGGTPWGNGTLLYFYKNDVLYSIKFIMNMGMYGTTLEDGTPVNIEMIENDDEIYKAMAKELENKGFTNIIGCYELTPFGNTTNEMKVSFTLGNDYNGKEVQILHQKSDNTYEIFKSTVADGKATITVSEFSPFMIALSSENTPAENIQNPTPNPAPNNAQTSSIDVVLYSILAIGSLLGITYIVFKSRKKVA